MDNFTLSNKLFDHTDILICGAAPRSPQWRQFRLERVRAHPYCAACGTNQELEAHHIIPYHLCPERELDPDNIEILCELFKCHFVEGHSRDWRAYNPHVVEDAARHLQRVKERLYSLEVTS